MALTHRRGFLRQSGLAAAGLPFWSSSLFAQRPGRSRLPRSKRTRCFLPTTTTMPNGCFATRGCTAGCGPSTSSRPMQASRATGRIGISLERFQRLCGHQSLRLDQRPSEPAHEHGRLRPDGQGAGTAGLETDRASGAVLGPHSRLDDVATSPADGGRSEAIVETRLPLDEIPRGRPAERGRPDCRHAGGGPPGFRVQYDFNEDSNFEAVYPVLKELERFPIAGRIEDPIRSIDQDGYRLLRKKCAIPILIHHGPAEVFMRKGLSDGFMASHAGIGSAMKLAAMAESTNTPSCCRWLGGPSTKPSWPTRRPSIPWPLWTT